jgi:hypothetical protein
MPTKQWHDAALPSPSWTFELLTGASPGVRLRGWVKMLQAGQFGEPTAAQVWAKHGDALTAEAEAHGFRPYWATKQTPTGAGFEQWRDAFLQQHQY